MRRIWLALLLSSIALLLAGCQSLSGNSNSGGSGVFTLNPTKVSFTNVKVGSNQKTNVTIANTGTADLTVTQATISGAGFTMSNLALPMPLHAGSSTTVSLTFAPPSSGAFSGSVTFDTTGAQGNVSLPLSGTAQAAGSLTANPSSVAFGNVPVGSSKTVAVSITNGESSSVTVSNASTSGAGLSFSGPTLPATIAAGQSATFNLKYSPASAGAVSGTLTISSNASNATLSVPLSATGVTPGQLTANPASLSFGGVQVGSTSSKSETVTNTGGTTVTISQANVSGAGYSVSGLTLPTALSASQSVTFSVKFAPTGTGTVNGSLSLVSDASNSPLGITLSGSGTTPGQLAVSPATLSFGNVTVGGSTALNGTLTASGASVTISSAGANSGEFAISGITLPTTLAAGQSAGFKVTFSPQATGTATASLTFSSNATNGPITESLTGSGTAANHSVALTWNTSSGAVGYNVYRGSASGGPYSMINTSLDALTSYTDTSVAAGTTYYYVVTAVDSSANESGYSNQATAIVPSP